MRTRQSKKLICAGWSLLEMLVVVVVIVFIIPFVAALLPRRGDAIISRCANNVRGLATGWSTYPSDNQEQLMPNPGWAAGVMNWNVGNPDNTNAAQLVDPSISLMADYCRSVGAYKCPADNPKFAVERARSYSMNAALAGTNGLEPQVRGDAPSGKKYFGMDVSGTNHPAMRISDLNLPGPASVFVFLEEQADSINDATFRFDPGCAATAEQWIDLPSSAHRKGRGAIAFADGHAEFCKWAEVVYPVKMTNYAVGQAPWNKTMKQSEDYEWLQARMPYR